jgi:hypothetical protein
VETELDTAYRILEQLQTFGAEWVNIRGSKRGFALGAERLE